MGDLERDTTIDLVDRSEDGTARYRATLSQEWEIWGPMGGYVASVALRAAGAESPFARPASFFCQYHGVAKFEAVDIEVRALRVAKTAIAQRITVTQTDRPILEATVWSVGEVDGLVHDATAPMYPEVPRPDELQNIEELLTDEERQQGPPFPFWNNFDARPIGWSRDPQPRNDPTWREWLRFTPTATFSDPWVDACRALIVVDVQSWPSASGAHEWGHGFIAPSLDLYVAFHAPRPESAWFLADGSGPVARDGLMAWNGRMWSDDGVLIASGMGQLLCRRVG